MTTRKKTDSPTRLSFSFPEPPSMNQMLALAKKRTRKGRDGGWMKRSMPIVYDNARHSYQLDCLRETRAKGGNRERELQITLTPRPDRVGCWLKVGD